LKKRATKTEQERRLDDIEELLLKGHKESEVVKMLSLRWNCGAANVRKYIRDLKQTWEKLETAPRAQLKVKYTRRLEELFKEALVGKSLKIALEIQKEINRIEGMYEPSKENKPPIQVLAISEQDQSGNQAEHNSQDEDDDHASESHG
jgi:hypothetical protein